MKMLFMTIFSLSPLLCLVGMEHPEKVRVCHETLDYQSKYDEYALCNKRQYPDADKGKPSRRGYKNDW